MNALLRACTIAGVLTLHACGGGTEGDTALAPPATIDVPINPLPLSERN